MVPLERKRRNGMNDLNIPEKLKQEFNELHERIYALSCEHRRYAPKMSDDLNKAIEEALKEEYSAYHRLYKKKLDTEIKIQIQALEQKAQVMIPVRRRRWWAPWTWKRNQAAVISDEMLAALAPMYFSELETHIETAGGYSLGSPEGSPTEAAQGAAETPESGAEPAPGEAYETAHGGKENAPPPPAAEWEEYDEDLVPHEGSTSAPPEQR